MLLSAESEGGKSLVQGKSLLAVEVVPWETVKSEFSCGEKFEPLSASRRRSKESPGSSSI